RVVRIFLRELFHRALVGQTAGGLIDLVEILVVDVDRRDPVAFALGLGADRLALLHPLQAVLQSGGGERKDQWIWAVADRDSPVGDGALRIGRRRFGERLNAVRIVERMDERDAAVELLLRLRRA